MKKGKSTAIFVAIVVLIAVLGYVAFSGITVFNTYRVKPFSEVIGKGLDLVGGISVETEIKDFNIEEEHIDYKALTGKEESELSDTDKAEVKEKYINSQKEEAVNRTVELIEMRINKLGVGETTVAPEGQNRIRIEIPGKYSASDVIDVIGKTGQLEFKSPDGEVILTGKDVKNAVARMDEYNRPEVGLILDEEGTKKFAEATEKYIGQSISIYMDDELILSPTVQTAITNGEASITNMESLEKAEATAGVIKSGALPVVLETVSYKTVGSTLGKNAMDLSMKAAIIGVLLVMLYMIVYYRVPGLIASIALGLFIILDLLAFASVGGVLTLAGIAGLLLTIGMAVDANVLIFERIKEEIKIGKSAKAAVESGFKRALSSIIDSNITTLIAAIVLYYVGAGSVKGLALTLMIGIVISIFTALVFTKYMLKLCVNMGIMNKPAHFRVKRG